jgi:hypothetical protein
MEPSSINTIPATLALISVARTPVSKALKVQCQTRNEYKVWKKKKNDDYKLSASARSS